MTQQIAGLSEIADRFAGVVTDQYGVLHDGVTPFPGALAALEGLARRGIPVVALTNSGKRSEANLRRLDRLGFRAGLFRDVVSSGEVARLRLAEDLARGRLPERGRVLAIARDGDTGLLDGLGLAVVEAGEPADLVLIAGIEPERVSRAAYAERLKPYAEAGTPALLVNPDTLMTTASGPAFGAGAVAEDYREMGGPVEALGKPAPAMYAAALKALGGPDPASVLMIGDSPAHDIAGAAAAGMATLLIEGGVQAGLDGAAADFAMAGLRW